MSLVNWRKKNLLPSFSFADDFFNDEFMSPFSTQNFFPAANIVETDKEFNIELAIPGMKKEDIIVEAEKGILTIRAEKEETSEEKDKSYTRKEYNYNSFKRSFSLPDDVKDEGIVANYNDGILNVKLPKMKTKAVISKKVKVT